MPVFVTIKESIEQTVKDSNSVWSSWTLSPYVFILAFYISIIMD